MRLLTNSKRHNARAENTVVIARLRDNSEAISLAPVEGVLPVLPIETVPQGPRFVKGAVFVILSGPVFPAGFNCRPHRQLPGTLPKALLYLRSDCRSN